jgi:hypothetical protein
VSPWALGDHTIRHTRSVPQRGVAAFTGSLFLERVPLTREEIGGGYGTMFEPLVGR